MKTVRALAAVVILAMTTVACSQSGDVEIDDAWARTSAASQDNGAAYMTLVGGDAGDRLLSVSVPSSVAAMAMMHETVMNNDVMSMQPVEGVDIPAGDSVAFAPGGYHVMLMNLAAPLVDGMEFDLVLTFEKAGDRSVTFVVRDE